MFPTQRFSRSMWPARRWVFDSVPAGAGRSLAGLLRSFVGLEPLERANIEPGRATGDDIAIRDGPAAEGPTPVRFEREALADLVKIKETAVFLPHPPGASVRLQHLFALRQPTHQVAGTPTVITPQCLKKTSDTGCRLPAHPGPPPDATRQRPAPTVTPLHCRPIIHKGEGRSCCPR